MKRKKERGYKRFLDFDNIPSTFLIRTGRGGVPCVLPA